MFAKLKKKIAEENAVAQRPGGATRIPRSVSKESVASLGADSGDDFASDGSSSREDLSSQLLRRNEQIRKLESRLSDYAEQVRNLQKIKEKLEIALEKHQDSSMRKFQEQNETFQANRAKMAEGLALALARKDQEWSEKMDQLEKDKRCLTAQLQEMKNQSLNLFQRRDEMDELEGFQQQELSKIKHMLLKKEESLGEMEQELEARTRELSQTQKELMTSNQMSSDLSQKLEELQRHYSTLEEQRDIVTASKTGAENKITALEGKEQELQAFIQRLSIDLQKVTAEAQEKEKLIIHLQEKVVSLEKRVEQNLSGEENVQELLKEKTVAEQKLEDIRQQLLAARSTQAMAIDNLEIRVKELEQTLQASEEKLKQSNEVVAAQEAQIQELSSANRESSQAQQKALALEQQYTERIYALEAQIAALEKARQIDKTAVEHEMRELEQENADLKESRKECEHSLQHHQLELKKLKEEWGQREIVSVAMAQALDEVRKQREEYQQQTAHLTAVIDKKEQSLQEKNEVILQKEQEIFQLTKGLDSALLQMHQLRSELEALKSLSTEEPEVAAAREDLLRLPGQEQGLALSTREPHVTLKATKDCVYQLPVAEGTPNGEVAAMDLGQLQKEKQNLEQQLIEKNKTIKQMQQRMLELKKTLQKELKIRPENELFEVREKPVPEMPNVAPCVTNNADLTDAREINFEYLKHVVLKFMSCRESEAFHLIKAVSVLLNFSQEEENMLKETLEYKMSWFGSKPAPKGSIRPSISNPRIPWT
ncbi:golgin subfamily A member 1 isoform X1 [Dasypus novemcinctus]|uniref:golgin subfamily A member 1 isoform X1 n=2 Tax=Dasypus novemcinctus TaxID=9361 RepID=UPI00265D8900|nr:golgin subfamily A member 1 isoform X1 [Dasypus novemcinctus]XP_058158362.1 golgin subfamily A member 1 isoform X1 [Dasypus novemcinctus]XP_058158363.1 golgin subfamily A member 1 isoform X1 [Dasypus novemcinctus]XP_058158364.1 golgin subfamily A member 1 isoform X1 [Dasypus novemcinctus]XP_058158365.1 golgin subfamily A member 1 isoform X1 [Dasypus novemcinctus]